MGQQQKKLLISTLIIVGIREQINQCWDWNIDVDDDHTFLGKYVKMRCNQLVVCLRAFKWPITGAFCASVDRLQITTLWTDYRLQITSSHTTSLLCICSASPKRPAPLWRGPFVKLLATGYSDTLCSIIGVKRRKGLEKKKVWKNDVFQFLNTSRKNNNKKNSFKGWWVSDPNNFLFSLFFFVF